MAGETSAPSTLPKYHMAKNWHQEQWFWKEALRHYYLKSKMIAKPLSFFWWVLTPLGCSCHETSPHSHVINQKVGPKTSAKEGAMSPGVKKNRRTQVFSAIHRGRLCHSIYEDRKEMTMAQPIKRICCLPCCGIVFYNTNPAIQNKHSHLGRSTPYWGWSSHP